MTSMIETRSCACGCGKPVTRDSSKNGFYNAQWFANQECYKKKKGREVRQVRYTTKIKTQERR